MEPLNSRKKIDLEFGPRFLAARKARQLSQEAVVEGMEKRGYSLPITAVGKIERSTRSVTLGEAIALADTLGFTLDALIGGEGELTTAFALQARERAEHAKQSRSYAETLLTLAATADNKALRGSDRAWLQSQLANQTPAQNTVDVLMFVEAAIARNNVDAGGEHVRLLLEALGRDKDALRAIRADDSALQKAKKDALSGRDDG
jgi:transcriptional regulator with XRE-family HTH domain